MAAYQALRILLVDDNQHMRTITATILASAGFRCIREVRDGAEAIEALRDWPADLAIVDFNMAPIDGVEFTRRVRRSGDSPNPYLPIIMMTGHSERRRVIEARDAGVTDFLGQPITPPAGLYRSQTLIQKPRPCVTTENYFGPCRRRISNPAFTGPWRRGSDAALESAKAS